MFDTMTLTKVVGRGLRLASDLSSGIWAPTALYAMDRPLMATGPVAGSLCHRHRQRCRPPTPRRRRRRRGRADAAADPAAGEKVFGKCKACHKLDGKLTAPARI
jgi:cytochrome c